LHAHFAHAPAELAVYLAGITGQSYSISAHAKDIYTFPAEELRERATGAKFIVTCTRHNLEWLRAALAPAERERVFLAYHGVDLGAFPAPEAMPEFPQRRLITVARLVEKKGYEHALRALAELRAWGFALRYDVYGEGPSRARLLALAGELGVSDLVHWHGSVTQPVVRSALAEGGVFVLGCVETPNGDRDGIPNSLAEAMSAGLPVVATRVSGIPELVTSEESGLLCPPGDPVALARAIRRLFEEPGLAARLATGGRERVAEVFEAERCLDEVDRLLSAEAGRP
jgi:glycosyltransferase involved in cell wall biosynthesis